MQEPINAYVWVLDSKSNDDAKKVAKSLTRSSGDIHKANGCGVYRLRW